MSVDGSPGAGKVMQAVLAIAQHIVAGIGDQAVKPGFMGDDPMQRVMKLSIVFENLVQLLPLERIFSLADKIIEFIDCFVGNTFANQPDSVSFQGGPDIKEVLHFLARITRNGKSPAFQRLDQSLGFEFVQSFSDRCAADSQASGQMLFSQAFTRVEPPGQHIRFQIVIGQLPHRERFFSGLLLSGGFFQCCIQLV